RQSQFAGSGEPRIQRRRLEEAAGGRDMMMKIDLPKSAWRDDYAWTALMLAAIVPLAAILTETIMTGFSDGNNLAGSVASIVMPIILGGPSIFYMAIKHQQLRLANERLHELASTDWLTGTLSRRAFASLVEQRLGGRKKDP